MYPLWFKARSFGWGWTPIGWQGWLVVALFLALLLAGTGVYLHMLRAGNDTLTTTMAFLVCIASLVGALIVIAFLTGENPGRGHWW